MFSFVDEYYLFICCPYFFLYGTFLACIVFFYFFKLGMSLFLLFSSFFSYLYEIKRCSEEVGRRRERGKMGREPRGKGCRGRGGGLVVRRRVGVEEARIVFEFLH